MKTKLCSFVAIIFYQFVLGQTFPSPQNFNLASCYNNYPLGGTSCGPGFPPFATVNYYSFEAPDLSGTSATLQGYNLYVDGTFLVNFTTTQYTGVCEQSGEYYVTAVYTNPSGESVASNKIFAGQLLSQQQFEITSIAIYPNPVTKKILHISSPSAIHSVMVYNALGEAVAKTNSADIDFQDFANGIYFVKIINDTAVVVKKIIN